MSWLIGGASWSQSPYLSNGALEPQCRASYTSVNGKKVALTKHSGPLGWPASRRQWRHVCLPSSVSGSSVCPALPTGDVRPELQPGVSLPPRRAVWSRDWPVPLYSWLHGGQVREGSAIVLAVCGAHFPSGLAESGWGLSAHTAFLFELFCFLRKFSESSCQEDSSTHPSWPLACYTHTHPSPCPVTQALRLPWLPRRGRWAPIVLSAFCLYWKEATAPIIQSSWECKLVHTFCIVSSRTEVWFLIWVIPKGYWHRFASSEG